MNITNDYMHYYFLFNYKFGHCCHHNNSACLVVPGLFYIHAIDYCYILTWYRNIIRYYLSIYRYIYLWWFILIAWKLMVELELSQCTHTECDKYTCTHICTLYFKHFQSSISLGLSASIACMVPKVHVYVYILAYT